MLRRYSSNGLETIPIKSKTITIGTDKCDVIVKAKGVHPVHASIEQNLESGLFWLTDHSLAGRTTVNGRLINGQVELRNGDMVRFGKAQPFVFERRNIFPLKKGNDVGEIASNANDTNLSTLPILGTKKQLSRKPTPSKSPANRSVASKLKSKRYDPYTEEISRRGAILSLVERTNYVNEKKKPKSIFKTSALVQLIMKTRVILPHHQSIQFRQHTQISKKKEDRGKILNPNSFSYPLLEAARCL
ncbi:FHA domain protein [Dictyocaulus viviparus]|uniref:FHA domain protein n=1 Tax=Dictyocaulus viviparus TaxID=29172 RepID=A0A0D8Y583_DICVI|nr:FHA domain protein [Dictyocaulus viviparus]